MGPFTATGQYPEATQDRLMSDTEIMALAADFLSHRDAKEPTIRGRDEICMFVQRAINAYLRSTCETS